MPNDNYGVFCSSGWCEMDHLSGRASKEKAEKMLLYYTSRPLGNGSTYIIAQHLEQCSKRYPGCCIPRIRIDESVVIEKRI